MSAPLLSDLREPPVIGRFYLVPVIHADSYAGVLGDLPVIGPAHTDREHFNFPHRHYHVDARFLRAADRRKLASFYGDSHGGDEYFTLGAMPLSNTYSGGVPKGLPRLARRKCASDVSPYRHDRQAAVQALKTEFGEPDAIPLPDGRRLCPHRKVDLSSFAPNRDGFVTCPLHGLRVRCVAPAPLSPIHVDGGGAA